MIALVYLAARAQVGCFCHALSPSQQESMPTQSHRQVRFIMLPAQSGYSYRRQPAPSRYDPHSRNVSEAMGRPIGCRTCALCGAAIRTFRLSRVVLQSRHPNKHGGLPCTPAASVTHNCRRYAGSSTAYISTAPTAMPITTRCYGCAVKVTAEATSSPTSRWQPVRCDWFSLGNPLIRDAPPWADSSAHYRHATGGLRY